MNLSKLVRKHITIIIESRHSESTVSPTNQLHGGNIGQVMLQVASRIRLEVASNKLGFVVSIIDL